LLDSLFGNIKVIERAMNGLGARQRVIGENVANVDTPKYKRMEVAYEAQLRAALKAEALTDELPMATASGRHFSVGPLAEGLDHVSAQMNQVTDETFRVDGNNVDVDTEMAKLAETNLRYNTMATLARNKFDGLKSMLRDIR
jgi:flagellar basal-body rod protein FlgB